MNLGQHSDEDHASHLYFDATFKRNAVKLLPGQYYVTRDDMVLVTTLGSCVSACIRDKFSGIGGMNHFMLPANSDGNDGGWGTSSSRYGTFAMEMLLNHLHKLGAKRQNLEAKLFGGGAVVRSISSIKIGEINVKFASDFLQQEGIALVANDLLDIFPRKVYYFPHSGEVRVKKLLSTHNQTLFDREQNYKSRLEKSKLDGDIELFA